MKVKTRVHVAVFTAGLVEVEVDTDSGSLEIQAGLVSCSAPTLNGCAMPGLTAEIDGADIGKELNERVTRIAGYLLTQEVESILRKKIEGTGATREEYHNPDEPVPGAKA